jgi:hypothetical protein
MAWEGLHALGLTVKQEGRGERVWPVSNWSRFNRWVTLGKLTGQGRKATEVSATYADSPDGRHILYMTFKQPDQYSLCYVDVRGDPAPHTFLQLNQRFHSPDLSSQGWVAFSMETTRGGGQDVFVARFPEGSERTLVSNSGGYWPKWTADGDRLFYSELDGTIVEVAVTTEPELRLSEPTRLFKRDLRELMFPYDWPDPFEVTPDEKSFLIAESIEERERLALVLAENWSP